MFVIVDILIGIIGATKHLFWTIFWLLLLSFIHIIMMLSGCRFFFVFVNALNIFPLKLQFVHIFSSQMMTKYLICLQWIVYWYKTLHLHTFECRNESTHQKPNRIAIEDTLIFTFKMLEMKIIDEKYLSFETKENVANFKNKSDSRERKKCLDENGRNFFVS